MRWQLFGEQRTYEFKGAYDHDIQLTLYPQKPREAGHVVMLALYGGKYVFARHKQRGLEWPGGKVEAGETALQAMVRELAEETGAVAASMWLVAQYEIGGEAHSFLKNVYAGTVARIDPKFISGEDTAGCALVDMHIDPHPDKGFSPLVCDPVFRIVRQKVHLDEYTLPTDINAAHTSYNVADKTNGEA